MAAPVETTKIGQYYPPICTNHSKCGGKLVNDSFHLDTFYLKIREITEKCIKATVFHYQYKEVMVGHDFLSGGVERYENRLFTFEKKPKIIAQFLQIKGDAIPNALMQSLSAQLKTHYGNEINNCATHEL